MAYHIMPKKQTDNIESSIATLNTNVNTLATNATNGVNKIAIRTKTITHQKTSADNSLIVSDYATEMPPFSLAAATYTANIPGIVSSTTYYYVPLYSISHTDVVALYKNSSISSATNKYTFSLGQCWLRKNTSGSITTVTMRLCRYSSTLWYVVSDALRSTTSSASIKVDVSWLFGPTWWQSWACN